MSERFCVAGAKRPRTAVMESTGCSKEEASDALRACAGDVERAAKRIREGGGGSKGQGAVAGVNEGQSILVALTGCSAEDAADALRECGGDRARAEMHIRLIKGDDPEPDMEPTREDAAFKPQFARHHHELQLLGAEVVSIGITDSSSAGQAREDAPEKALPAWQVCFRYREGSSVDYDADDCDYLSACHGKLRLLGKGAAKGETVVAVESHSFFHGIPVPYHVADAPTGPCVFLSGGSVVYATDDEGKPCAIEATTVAGQEEGEEFRAGMGRGAALSSRPGVLDRLGGMF